ncbi:MAG: DUF5110 domain-containing protein [Chitinophagaceae bacterium]|nr:MAG: DUF5110 domain-containing protein [Chitinophagaceae bacterium]
MTRTLSLLIPLALLLTITTAIAQPRTTDSIAPGVTKISEGKPDQFNLYHFSDQQPMLEEMKLLPAHALPFDLNEIRISTEPRGVLVEIPLTDNEQLYGFGLQIGSFNQRGLRKKPIVNDNPSNDLGYTHAPMPFYVSNKGYGILVNTARYTTFYCGSTEKNSSAASIRPAGPGNSVEDLYQNRSKGSGYVAVDVPGAGGVEVFIFAGPELLQVIQRYNLFSGGGALPALWGLGVKYRVKADFNQQQVSNMATYFRDNHLPCDVLGLEPRWQTAAYSCSYVWNRDFFPSPDRFIDTILSKGFRLNLWEHAFVNPASPIHDPLKSKSGDYLVWNGLVPDFADPSAGKIFSDYHRSTFVEKGVSGFKLDECDNSNLLYGNSTWSFPEHSRFPSGIDGEQMHQVFGIVYQKAIYKIYKDLNRRTYLDVRASNAFASPYPAALYSDTYDHREYIRMIPNSGFGGLIWSPEVRESASVEEFMRRTQTAVLSAQTLFNAWYLQYPPWLQINREKNNNGEFMENAKAVEADLRELLNHRMSLLPYLYNAFAQYRLHGTPPFRALVVDYPHDEKVFNLSDEYMIGEDILAAPLTSGSPGRKVYLPEGNWYDFNTNRKFAGGQEYTFTCNYNQLPIFIKEGTLLPLAKPVEHVNAGTVFELHCKAYGNTIRPATLFEDDGESYDFEKGQYNKITIDVKKGKTVLSRTGKFKGRRYIVTGTSTY